MRDIIWVRNTPQATTATILYQLKGIVTAVASGYITVRAIETQTNVSSAADTVGLNVFVIGSAAEEGGRSKTGSYTFPIEVTNYTQIYRTAFSFTRTALKAGLRFDDTGVYRTKAKKNSLRHMSVQELACFFSVKRTDTVTNDDGDSVPETKPVVSNGSSNNMNTALSATAELLSIALVVPMLLVRRIGKLMKISASFPSMELLLRINLTILSSVPSATLRKNLSRSFASAVLVLSPRSTNCDHNSIKTTTLNSKEDSYGMNLTRWETPYGVLYFKSHPLFNQDAAFPMTLSSSMSATLCIVR